MENDRTVRVRKILTRLVFSIAVFLLAILILLLPFAVGILAAIEATPTAFLIYVAVLCSGALLTVLYFVVVRIRATEKAIGDVYAHVDPAEVAELTESRREIVAAFEIERRRIERDLHDGAQQYLVTASLDIGEADLLLDSAIVDGRVIPDKMAEVRGLLSKAQDDAEAALRSLRATVAGIHPKVLSDLGLEAAVRSVAASSPVKAEVFVPHRLPALPEGVIAAAYFLVSEGLTNVAKYAPAARVSILLAADENLHVTVSDDGPGGASIQPDRGLSGMRERLAAFGGVLDLVSPVGGPTTLSGRIPLLLRRGEFSVMRAESAEASAKVPTKVRRRINESPGANQRKCGGEST